MSRLGRELLYHRIEAASGTADRKALDLVLQEYGVLLSFSASQFSFARCLCFAETFDVVWVLAAQCTGPLVNPALVCTT